MMEKKCYEVEFSIIEVVLAENEDEAYHEARARIESSSADDIRDKIFNFDNCVSEVSIDVVWDKLGRLSPLSRREDEHNELL
jgi:hypothetical protein